MKRVSNVLLMALLLAALILLPIIINSTYIIIVLGQTLISIVVLMGLNFITGLMGQMNLGTAGIMALGAYTSALLCTRLSMSPWLAMLFVILMGGLLGVGLGYPSLRIKGIYLALTTLGFSEIIRLVLNNLIDLTGGPTGVRNIPDFNLFGYEISGARPYYYLLLTFVIVLMIIAIRIIKSKWGRAIKAIKDSDMAVEACGISLSSIKIFAFTLCCIYGCIGGALYAHFIGYISPADFTTDTSIRYLMMLMIGGIGSTAGNVIGAIIVNILPEMLRFLDSYYWLVFSTVVLVCSVVIPNGLVSVVHGAFQRLSARLKISLGENGGMR